MRTKKTLDAAIVSVMQSALDDFLREHFFSRTQNSLTYSRRISRGHQRIRVPARLRPRYRPEAIAHLVPNLTVSFPEVNDLTFEMVGRDEHLVSNIQDVTFREPLEFSAPKGHYIHRYVYDEKGLHECFDSIREFIAEWVIPFLDECSSIESMITLYELHDHRLIKSPRMSLSIAAAHIILGNPRKAMEVLDETFRAPGPRKKFAKAFEYVSNLLRE